MDGSYITDIRTGASAGVAARYLARKDAKVLAIIGAGVQGKMNARAVCEELPIEEIRVADIRPEACEAYAEEMGPELQVKVTPCATNEEACKGADVIITVTIADEPLVMWDWLKPGCTVLSLGSFQELDEEIPLKSDKLVVDNWAQNAHRGELVKLVHAGRLTEEQVHAEMPEIVVGEKPGREKDEEIICACIIGMGSTDIGTAGVLYKEFFSGDEVQAIQREYLKISGELSGESWGNDEYRRELLLAAEGVCVMAELSAKLAGYGLERVSNTEEWLCKYREKWLEKNKASELYRIEELFLYYEQKACRAV